MSRAIRAPGTLLMPLIPLSRRAFLAGTGLAVGSLTLPAHAQPPNEPVLHARSATAALQGEGQPPTPIWGYDGTAPGPLLRLKRDEELRVRLVNELPEPTAIHWHGVRLPNPMDGVPGLTQPAVAPGASFDYRFGPPDAGTYWYRAANNAQSSRGLRGALIVDEPTPPAVDRDVLLLFEDWPTADGLVTINGAPAFELSTRPNERLRLRVIHGSLARTLTLRFERHAATVMAIDGQPAEPFLARDGRVMLGPGNRLDLFVDMTLGVGDGAALLLADAGSERPIMRFLYAGKPERAAPLAEPAPLPPNSLPARLDLRNASRHELALDTLPPLPASVHEKAPAFTVNRGRVVVLAFNNRTDVAQSVHLHGHAFRLLDRLDDGWKPFWLDTLTVGPHQTDRIAFLADNPGKWLIEAQGLGTQTSTATWFAVT